MNMNERLEINVALMIQKSPHEVFEAIADPAQMCNYFISKSSGRMEAGKTLTWEFPEMQMQFPVHISKVETDKFLCFHWADPEGNDTKVEISLLPKENNSTFVKVKEKDRAHDEEGLKWLGRNTEGWANFLACLKAWMEYGINLRKGAFDLSQMPEKNTA